MLLLLAKASVVFDELAICTRSFNISGANPPGTSPLFVVSLTFVDSKVLLEVETEGRLDSLYRSSLLHGGLRRPLWESAVSGLCASRHPLGIACLMTALQSVNQAYMYLTSQKQI